MKLKFLTFVAVLLTLISMNAYPQSWSALATFPGMGREGASTFTINNVIYMVGGINDAVGPLREVWAYDINANTWVQKAPAPWLPRFFGVAFSISNKGYYGSGNVAAGRADNISAANDFFQYDPQTDIWTNVASVGAVGFYGAAGFSIGNKGYVAFGGNSAAYNYVSPWVGTPINKIYEFDPSNGAQGTWNLVATTSNGYAVISPQSFVINNKAYIAGGFVPGTMLDPASGVDGVSVANCVQFDPSNYSVTAMASMPSTYQRHFASAFSLYERGYIVGGNYSYNSPYPEVGIYSNLKSEMLKFNPYSNSWSVVSSSTSVGYNSRAVSVASCNIGYILGGVSVINGSPSYSHSDYSGVVSSDPDYIVGPPLICNTGQYSLQSLPQGMTASWSTSNPNGLSINSSSGLATRVNNFNGVIQVSAALNSAGCSQMQLQPISVYVGQPQSQTIEISSNPDPNGLVCSGNFYGFRASPTGLGFSYNWTADGGNVIGGQGTNVAQIYFSDNNYMSVFVTASNGCGSAQGGLGVSNNCGSGGGRGCIICGFTASPNPASSSMNIILTKGKNNQLDEVEINLFNDSQMIEFSKITTNQNIIVPVSNLRRGSYFLHIRSSKEHFKEHVIIN